MMTSVIAWLAACHSQGPNPPSSVLDSDSAEIGRSGGAIEVSGGGATVTVEIPSGALAEPVTVSATLVRPAAGELVRVELSPAGLELQAPAAVRVGLQRPIPAEAAVSWDGHLAPSVVVDDGMGLDAELWRLPAADGDPAARAARGTSGGAVGGPGSITVQQQLDLIIEIEAMKALAQNLERDDQYEDAFALWSEIAALLQKNGMDGWADTALPALRQMGVDACAALDGKLAALAQTQPSDGEQLWEMFEEVLHWHSTALLVGADCGVDLDAALGPKVAAVVAYWERQQQAVTDASAPGYDTLVSELDGSDTLLQHTRSLHDLEIEAMVSEQAAPVLYDTVRAPSFASCLADDSDPVLTLLSGRPDDALGGLLQDDMHQCTVRIGATSLDASGDALASLGQPLGGVAPGRATRAGALRIDVDGSVRIDGRALSRPCPDGASSADALRLDIDGAPVRTLTGPGALLGAPVTLAIRELWAAAGVPADDEGPHELSLVRTSGGGCAGLYPAGDRAIGAVSLSQEEVCDAAPDRFCLSRFDLPLERWYASKVRDGSMLIVLPDTGEQMFAHDGQLEMLPTGFRVVAISRDTVAGMLDEVPMRWHDGTLTELTLPPSTESVSLRDIDPAGDVLGHVVIDNGPDRQSETVRWTAGGQLVVEFANVFYGPGWHDATPYTMTDDGRSFGLCEVNDGVGRTIRSVSQLAPTHEHLFDDVTGYVMAPDGGMLLGLYAGWYLVPDGGAPVAVDFDGNEVWVLLDGARLLVHRQGVSQVLDVDGIRPLVDLLDMDTLPGFLFPTGLASGDYAFVLFGEDDQNYEYGLLTAGGARLPPGTVRVW